MKSLMYLFVLLIAASFDSLQAQPMSSSTSQVFKVEVEVTGISEIKGDLRIGVYSVNNKFASKTDVYDFRIIPVEELTAKVTFEIPNKGNYALAILHDVSKNGKMDFNFIGFPKEPYGFSKNPGIWYRVPTFDECAFEVSKDMSLKVEL